jgi:hypothetical protein
MKKRGQAAFQTKLSLGPVTRQLKSCLSPFFPALVFAACTPQPVPSPDSGIPDAGSPDAGMTDGGMQPCTLNMSCDPGDGTMNGYCVQITDADGGLSPYCEAPV